MAQEIINVGTTANDGTGDKVRNAFIKVNNNFTEIYDEGGANITVNNPVTSTETDLDTALADLATNSGSQTLAEVLVEGNITDGTDISISDGDKIVLDNGANLKKGTTDAGLGGTKGIALRCAVDYELKWEAGRLYVMEGDGFTIREVSHNFTTTPTVTDDDTKGFVVDSRWILDNGDVYVCTDDTTGAAVWELVNTGTTPTLQEVLDNNHDLVDGNNFQGTGAGSTNTGSRVNAFGEDSCFANAGLDINSFGKNAGRNNTANDCNFIGAGSGLNNTGYFVNGLGAGSAENNTGFYVNAFGRGAGSSNSFKNINLFGYFATADADNQTVFSKWTTLVTKYLGRLSFNNITADRKWELPDASGTIALTSDIPAGGGGASISFYLNGSVSQGTIGSVAFKEMDRTPILGAGTNFTINADGYIQSFITDANVPNQLEIPAGNWNFETYFSASSGGGSPSFYVELYKWNGTTLSLIASNSTNPEFITGGTNIDLYVSALAVPQTTLLATDRLAVRIYVNHSSKTITLHTEDNNLCQVITTFTTGLTALNGLTEQVQYFDVGTGATNFNISSSGDTHTFNLLFNIRRNANNSSNNNINYNGYAVTGSAESSAVWTITRLTIAASGSITVATATNVAWTDRESATYI